MQLKGSCKTCKSRNINKKEITINGGFTIGELVLNLDNMGLGLGGPRPRWDRLDIEDQFMFAVGHPSNWKVTVELNQKVVYFYQALRMLSIN